jgi:23S rRNA (guanosine2251-2'-O)-methyltransferase
VGRHPLLEALRAGRSLRRILLASGSRTSISPELLRLAAERNVPVVEMPRERLDALAEHHQGVLAEAAPFAYADLAELLARSDGEAGPDQVAPLLLAVDSLQDPQNFGSLLRTALAVGAKGVLLPERRAVSVTAAVGRASAGAIEHLRIAQVTNLARALREAKEHGFWIVGLDVAGPQLYTEAELRGPMVVVVGAEGGGLGRLVAETCDLLVRIPMQGPLDSLNAAVAGSLVLYEAYRQRQSSASASS